MTHCSFFFFLFFSLGPLFSLLLSQLLLYSSGQLLFLGPSLGSSWVYVRTADQQSAIEENFNHLIQRAEKLSPKSNLQPHFPFTWEGRAELKTKKQTKSIQSLNRGEGKLITTSNRLTQVVVCLFTNSRPLPPPACVLLIESRKRAQWFSLLVVGRLHPPSCASDVCLKPVLLRLVPCGLSLPRLLRLARRLHACVPSSRRSRRHCGPSSCGLSRVPFVDCPLRPLTLLRRRRTLPVGLSSPRTTLSM